MRLFRIQFAFIIVTASFTSPGWSDDCSTTLFKQHLDGYRIELRNNCPSSVSWAYSICTEGSPLKEEKLTVPSRQLAIRSLKTGSSESMLLHYRVCEGCSPEVPTCKDFDNPWLDWFLDAEEEVHVQAAEPLPQLDLTEASTVIQSKDNSSTERGSSKTYQKLSSLKAPTDNQVQSHAILQAKPVTSTASTAPGSIRAVQFKTDAPIKPVAPAQGKPSGNAFSVVTVATQNAAVRSVSQHPASCVSHELGKRNVFGKSAVILKNLCLQPVNVGIRVCENKEMKLQTVVYVAAQKSSSEWVAHSADSTLTVFYNSCIGSQCTPQIPARCEN